MPDAKSTSRTLAALLVGVVIAAACGQKPGVSQLPGAAGDRQPATVVLPPGAHIDPETGQILDAEGNVIGDAADLGIADSAGGTLEAGGEGTEGNPTDDGSVAGRSGADNPVASSGAGSAVGVTGDTIKIGAHAPLTGAAPVPSDSAEKGNELYWRWLQHTDVEIGGRHVEALLRNDNYNPSQAVAVCKEMVEQDKVFLLYGFAGTDQIQACARYAASVGVPYLSTGVTETGLRDIPNYLALSLTYPEQGPLLADFLTSELGARGEKNGMLRFQTTNFEDAHDAFIRAMNDKKANVVYDRAVSKNAGSAEAQAVVQEMKSQGIDNVYVLTSPVWFLQVLQAAGSQNYSPQWVGVGITMTLDTVASVGCRNGTLNRAKFFSPFPAWAEINRFDRDFQEATATIYPEENGGDDVMIIGWGIAKVIAELLEAPGRNLTRERFIDFAERTRDLATGVYPPVTFSRNDHFGGTQVHVNEAHCSGYKTGDNRWHTIRSFVSDF